MKPLSPSRFLVYPHSRAPWSLDSPFLDLNDRLFRNKSIAGCINHLHAGSPLGNAWPTEGFPVLPPSFQTQEYLTFADKA